MIRNTKNLYLLVTIFDLSLVLRTKESNGQARKSRSKEFDTYEPPETKYQIHPYITFGSHIDFEYKRNRTKDLDVSTYEDLSTIEPAAVLAFSFDPLSYIQAFANFKISGEFEFEGGCTI